MRWAVLATTGLVSALIFAGPVAAQQTASRSQQAQRTPPRPVNWSGFQYGGFGGVSSMPMNFVEPGAVLCPGTGLAEPPGCPETPFSFSGRPVSATVGVFVGYNAQFGNTVGGIEADVAWKHGSISQTLSTAAFTGGIGCSVPPCPTVTRTEGFTGSMTQRADGSLRLRYGMLVTPWTLVYATGGGALGSVCGSFSYTAVLTGLITGTAFGADNWCQTRAGYTVGAGVETAVAMFANAKLRFEYRYTDFGSFSRDVPLVAISPACGGPFLCTGNAHIDMRAAFHTFRVGLGFGI